MYVGKCCTEVGKIFKFFLSGFLVIEESKEMEKPTYLPEGVIEETATSPEQFRGKYIYMKEFLDKEKRMSKLRQQ